MSTGVTTLFSNPSNHGLAVTQLTDPWDCDGATGVRGGLFLPLNDWGSLSELTVSTVALWEISNGVVYQY